MTKIILVRHGQTAWNLEKKFQGQSDIELSPLGLRQAARAGERLAGEKIDAVYASDLTRAFKTAEYIAAKHNLPVKAVPELREIKFGLWEGLSYSQIDERWPGEVEKMFLSPGETQTPEGENFVQVKERSYAAFLEIVKTHPNQTAVIVSHGGTIGSILCAALDINLKHIWSIRQDNTAVNIIEYHNDRAVITLLNDIHHLNGIE